MPKIFTLDDPAKFGTALTDVVLAHGTFDLLHIGHLRHLREAKAAGSHLIVTVTADEFVNKGPDRPVFSAQHRAEMLAALEFVDHVGILEAPNAVPAIKALRPAVYAKGPDYADPDQDVTGAMTLERAAVEAVGGRVLITDGEAHSSSALINRHLPAPEPELAAFLDTHRSRGALKSILGLIERAKDLRVLVIGDAIIDEYVYVEGMGKSFKEQIIVARRERVEFSAGGVFSVANHVAAMVKEVEVVTLVKYPVSPVIDAGLKSNVLRNMDVFSQSRTTRKTRFVDTSYGRKLFEIYDIDDRPITGSLAEAAIIRVLEKKASEFDLVLAADFGHGLMTPAIIKVLQKSAKFLAVNTQTNSANLGFNLITKYYRADYVCIDEPEARLATEKKFEPMNRVVDYLMEGLLHCSRLIVTHGKHGCVGRDEPTLPPGANWDGVPTFRRAKVPAFTKTVVDTVGAGDAFLGMTSPLAAVGGTIEQLAFIGNAAGALNVGIVGTREAVTKAALVKYITTLLK